MVELTVCEINKCVGCMACKSVCKKDAIDIRDSLIALNAYIDEEKCINCGLCRNICQINGVVNHNKPIEWKQGWADEKYRTTSTSGGIAQAIMMSFLKEGKVYSCTFEDGKFIYRLVKDEEDVIHFIGSKYVKSNPYSVYKQALEDLKAGIKVLFIGLPCHVQALTMYAKEYRNNLYTIDLICHGTPSEKLFLNYIKEEKIDTNKVDYFSFRQSLDCSQDENMCAVSSNPFFDFWLKPFMDALTFTEGCYYCKYACVDRVSDLTIGDSWGSKMDDRERAKGISLLLINSLKGKQLIEMINVYLADVDIQVAKQINTQLVKPSEKHINRVIFEKNIAFGYKSTIRKCYIKDYKKACMYNSLLWRVYRKIRKRPQNKKMYELRYKETE